MSPVFSLLSSRASSWLALSLLALPLSACIEPTRSDIRTSLEPAGVNCEYGGLKVETGFDDNKSGELDDEEVLEVDFICNQRVDGKTSLINAASEPAGANCEQGGVKITIGLDDDDDGILDAEEIEQTEYICHGRARLLSVVPIAPGTECETGGVEVTAGFDTNANGVLDPSEIDMTEVVCHGRASLTKITEEVAGARCPNGGIKIQTGFDTDGDSTLDPSEVQGTQYSCNGEDGYNTLVKTSTVTASTTGPCYFGGTMIQTGLDSDRDNILDSAEIMDTQYVCSIQVNENMTLVRNSAVVPGDRCTYGGLLTEVGVDDDNDGTLDDLEVDTSAYWCNEVIIVDGLTTLLTTTAATTSQCEFGGYQVKSGLDDDRDGNLDSTEVDQTRVICNGINGYNSVVKTESYSGSSCGLNGGIKISSGLDMDRDNVLDTSEATSSTIVCHGEEGTAINSLINTSDPGTACGGFGGVKVQVGLDDDGDNVLDSGEVDQTSYVCNGYDGYNSLVEISDDSGACGSSGGSLIEVGQDWDYDNVLDSSEVQNWSYVCNGYDGYSALIEATVSTWSACSGYEGLQLLIGLDYDYDGYLDSGEIQSELYVCDEWEAYYY